MNDYDSLHLHLNGHTGLPANNVDFCLESDFRNLDFNQQQ